MVSPNFSLGVYYSGFISLTDSIADLIVDLIVDLIANLIANLIADLISTSKLKKYLIELHSQTLVPC